MRTRTYRPIEVPIRLHLEYNQITVGELSNVLRHWQVVLRSAWKESMQLKTSEEMPAGNVPTVRLLISSASTENSFDIITDFATRAVFLGSAVVGPLVRWPVIARNAYGFLFNIWEHNRDESSEYNGEPHLYIRGRNSQEMRVPAEILADSRCAEQVVKLWKIANSGDIKITVDETISQSDDFPTLGEQASIRLDDE